MGQWPTTLALAISTSGERRCVGNRPMGLPDRPPGSGPPPSAGARPRCGRRCPSRAPPGRCRRNDQLLGPLADLQGVLPQAQDGFLAPALAAQRRAPLRGDGALFPNGHLSLPPDTSPCPTTVSPRRPLTVRMLGAPLWTASSSRGASNSCLRSHAPVLLSVYEHADGPAIARHGRLASDRRDAISHAHTCGPLSSCCI